MKYKKKHTNGPNDVSRHVVFVLAAFFMPFKHRDKLDILVRIKK